MKAEALIDKYAIRNMPAGNDFSYCDHAIKILRISDEGYIIGGGNNGYGCILGHEYNDYQWEEATPGTPIMANDPKAYEKYMARVKNAASTGKIKSSALQYLDAGKEGNPVKKEDSINEAKRKTIFSAIRYTVFDDHGIHCSNASINSDCVLPDDCGGIDSLYYYLCSRKEGEVLRIGLIAYDKYVVVNAKSLGHSKYAFSFEDNYEGEVSTMISDTDVIDMFCDILYNNCCVNCVDMGILAIIYTENKFSYLHDFRGICTHVNRSEVKSAYIVGEDIVYQYSYDAVTMRSRLTLADGNPMEGDWFLLTKSEADEVYKMVRNGGTHRM